MPTRLTLCTGCDHPIEIDARAKSTSCPRCHGRVVTESLHVGDYVAVRAFRVANHLHVGKKGIVYAAVRADALRVDGVLEGSAVALGQIHVGRRARVKADLRASSLVVEEGAVVVGRLQIGPHEVPELRAVAEAAAARAGPPAGRGRARA